MARIQPADTGINVIIYVSSKTGIGHLARIKVSNVPGTFSKNDNFSVSISDNPEVVAGTPSLKSNVMNSIFEWVRLNKIPLLKYWNDEYPSDRLFYAELSKLPK